MTLTPKTAKLSHSGEPGEGVRQDQAHQEGGRGGCEQLQLDAEGCGGGGRVQVIRDLFLLLNWKVKSLDNYKSS